MVEARNQQRGTTDQMDDTAGGVTLEVPNMDDGPTGETPSSSGELAVPWRAGNVADEIDEFIPGVRRYFKNMFGRELQENEESRYRRLFSLWNMFLQPVQGVQDTSAIISSDIKNDINGYILRPEEQRGEQMAEDNKEWTKTWLQRWDMFLQARAGKTLVTWCNLFLTIVGFILYIVDQVSDIGTSVYYAGNRQWWQAMGTLTIVYGAVIIHTVVKWTKGYIYCTGAADWLRYVGSLLVNWPDVKQYGALCRLEWKLHKSPACSAHLVPEWHERRVNVALLKYTEGVWEACPQAILQLCLLVPDLYGHWTWTGNTHTHANKPTQGRYVSDYLRIAGACVSLCTAGAALVNLEKYRRIMIYTDLPQSELVVLHVWAVPVTVFRLLSVTLLLSVHLYWALAGAVLHLVLCGVYWCRSVRVPRTLTAVLAMCLTTLQFCMSPFDVAGSVSNRRMSHAVHFLINTVMMVVWALGTLLVCAHPALYTAIICFNIVMFAVGLVGWQLHEYYWPGSNPRYNG